MGKLEGSNLMNERLQTHLAFIQQLLLDLGNMQLQIYNGQNQLIPPPSLSHPAYSLSEDVLQSIRENSLRQNRQACLPGTAAGCFHMARAIQPQTEAAKQRMTCVAWHVCGLALKSRRRMEQRSCDLCTKCRSPAA